MFKLLILQRLHSLSGERLQYQVSDRLSFMRSLGLELSGNIPDQLSVTGVMSRSSAAEPVGVPSLAWIVAAITLRARPL